MRVTSKVRRNATFPASAASTAALTVGLAAYAALILAAVMVGVLTLGGLVMAIVSSAA